ncbi:hypothetical protein HY250_00930 [Candidatus Azambacteria bacterium]|nr:hypothetical protein [Candidatus Azambacteria bacterium]
MEQALADEYKHIVTDLVKKQMEMIGPAVALSIARKVQNLKIDNAGETLDMGDDPKATLENVTDAYISFSGEIARMILRTVLKKYPDIKQ